MSLRSLCKELVFALREAFVPGEGAELGTIYCSHAWGLNPLCSHSPGVSVLTPALALSRDIPSSPGMALSEVAAWAWRPTHSTGRRYPPWCRGPKQFALAAAPQQVAPSLGPVHGTQRASADAGGRAVSAASALARQVLTEPSSRARLPTAPSLLCPTHPDPTRVHNIPQNPPISHGPGDRGKPPVLGDPAGDAPNRSERSGERRAPPTPGVHGETQVRESVSVGSRVYNPSV